MGKNLASLSQFVARKREEQRRVKCRTCRDSKMADAVDEAVAAAIKNPERYRGLNTMTLWEWSGAKAKGIGQSAFRVHLLTHRPEAYRALLDAVR